MRLIDAPVYATVRAFLGDIAEPVVLDVGANRGEESRAMLRELPRATVHAFEPSARCHADLEALARREPRLHVHRVAVGAEDDRTILIETESDLLSSVLPLNDLGLQHFGVCGGEVTRSETARVRLDSWARANGIRRVDVMKIDVQGAELDVLRGAASLLDSGVRLIYSEAQVLPEYAGAATLTDIDLFLRERGFSLHQIQEVRSRGPERQTSDVDALWVRNDALARHRAQLAGDDREAMLRMERALSALARNNLRRVAVYGAGAHTARAAPALFSPPVEIVAIIDDDPRRRGGRALGFPVIPLADAAEMSLDAVVISSDAHEGVLAARASSALRPTVPIVTLYADGSHAGPELVGVSSGSARR